MPALVCALALGSSFFGCQSSLDRLDDFDVNNPPVVQDDIRKVTAPDGFNFESAQVSEVKIKAVIPGTSTPAPNVVVSLWTETADSEPIKLAYGVTNQQGTWNPSVSFPIDRDSVTVLVETLGFPSTHRMAVRHDQSTSYTLGATNATGRVVPEVEPPFMDTSGYNTQTLAGRAPMNYMGNFDRNGVPEYLTDKVEVRADLLEFISTNLSESQGGVPVNNPGFIDPNNLGSLLMQQDGEVWISFAHEGAGYTNALGYFTYDPANPPSRKGRIDQHTIIFPNVSYTGSGGGLTTGDRVYLGKFSAGTAIGWFLVPNGWNSRRQQVRDNSATRYSIDKLNTFTSPDYYKHMVLLADEVNQVLVLGVEDLNRPSGDSDFNDAVFIVEPKPWNAVDITNTPVVEYPSLDRDNDGVIDDLDLYPTDPERAFETYTPSAGTHGTIAFEDMWPKIGDYDFNDLVVDFNFVEVLNANMEIVDINASFEVRAIGSSQNHGFALQFPFSPSEVKSVEGNSLLNNDYMTIAANGTEEGVNTTVVPVFADGFALFSERFGIINTDPTKPGHSSSTINMKITFARPMSRGEIGLAPYDPFMIRSKDRSREIHLAGMEPTSKADFSLFNTEADNSDLSLGHNYVDANNLPWALCIPSQFKHPAEQKRIDEVYNNFIDFATYGGQSSRDWFRENATNINGENAY